MTRYQLFLLGGILLIAFVPIAFTQSGRGKKGGDKKGMKDRGGPGAFGGGPTGGMGNPEDMWNRIAQGRDSININDVRPEMRERMEAFLKQKGITSGVLTRELFLEQMQAMGGRGGFGRGGPGSSGDSNIEEDARRSFDRMDRNKDGAIDREEAERSQTLRDFNRWDTNRDGKISVDEFIAAFREQRGSGGRDGAPAVEDKRPTVYRAGNLPRELQNFAPWFEQMDRDRDGQVGLYEWKNAGRATREFLDWDQNADGFVTVEEVLRFQRAQLAKEKAKNGTGSTALAGNMGGGGGGRMGMGKGGFGGFGGFGKGKGKGGDRPGMGGMDFFKKGGKGKGGRGGR